MGTSLYNSMSAHDVIYEQSYIMPIMSTNELPVQHRHKCLPFKFSPSDAKCPGNGTGIIPGKHPDTKQTVPLTNGHGRYITTCPLGMAVSYSRYKFVTAPLPKRLPNGRFNS
jgi:hypothetical protein